MEKDNLNKQLTDFAFAFSEEVIVNILLKAPVEEKQIAKYNYYKKNVKSFRLRLKGIQYAIKQYNVKSWLEYCKIRNERILALHQTFDNEFENFLNRSGGHVIRHALDRRSQIANSKTNRIDTSQFPNTNSTDYTPKNKQKKI